jgi:hypothetical protein
MSTVEEVTYSAIPDVTRVAFEFRSGNYASVKLPWRWKLLSLWLLLLPL